MLTDIFAYRYSDHRIWHQYTEVEQRLLVQVIGIAKEALPYYNYEGKEHEENKVKWRSFHDKLSRELGVDQLSDRYFWTTNTFAGQTNQVAHTHPWVYLCEMFVKKQPPDGADPDRFIKERISLAELVLRERGDAIALANSKLETLVMDATARALFPSTRGVRLPGDPGAGIRAMNKSMNDAFNSQVSELNERFRRAKAPLTYHNGFIQLALDEQIERQVAKPFWDLVSDPMWKNVSIDMAEALDQRDSKHKDCWAFAAKALESAIKIVCDQKNWTTGNEKGAANYIDNLVSSKNGGYLDVWEGDMLKDYFRKCRNPALHGAGSDPMPDFSLEQIDWAIESAMSWIRTVVRRL
jgi:AbiJ N-terminal domain 4